MNYEDEDYVRFYTRDTVSWLALGWEGQAVLALMLHGKFDRSGVFDCDGHTPSHAVTMVTRIPEDVVERGIERLFKAGTWVHRDGKIVWPKYLHAQNCRRSDRARQRESREKRRNDALRVAVEKRDTPEEDVTACDGSSQPVTPSLAEPSRDPPTPLPGSRDPFGDSLTGKAPGDREDVKRLFERFKRSVNRPGLKLLRGSHDLQAVTLAEAIDAHGEDDCNLVADEAPNDRMVNGDADQGGMDHRSVKYVFGNQDAFARILAAAKVRQKPKGKSWSELRRAGLRGQP